MTALTAAEVVAALKAVHEQNTPPDADQRTAAYWWGKPDESVAWWLCLCRRVAPDPVSQSLYIAHVAEDLSHKRDIKDWAYRVAAECAVDKRHGVRVRAAVESYRPEWGHVAARDGLALALWPHLADGVPGINRRTMELKCGGQAYQRIRDGVRDRAKELIAVFRSDMDQCLKSRYRRDFIERWEFATGKEWPRTNWDG